MSLPNDKDSKPPVDPIQPIDPDELMHEEEGQTATSSDAPDDLVRAFPPTPEPTGMEDPDDLIHQKPTEEEPEQ